MGSTKDKKGFSKTGTPNRDYHRQSLYGRGGAYPLIHKSGETTTVMTTGVDVGGKIYSVPAYDQHGKIIPESKLAKHWAKEIKAGVFPSYKTGKKPSGVSQSQFIKNHPSNVAARKAHHVIDQDMANFRSGRRGRNKASLLRRWADNKRK
jgi:hypothetical protein